MTIDLHDIFPQIGEMDKKSVYALLRALKNSFDPNKFEYLRFKKSVAALEKMNMDTSTSYKSAFATAETMGLTKENLISSAQKYLRTLEHERESFATALLARKKEKVDGKKDEVELYKDKIESHKQKILELQREIEIFQSKIDNVDLDVDSATKKIEGTKNRFLGVYNVLFESIKSDIDTITKYL